MALPTFQTFSLQDSNFITERITFKGFADRDVEQMNANRREGVKLLATEFRGKKVTIEGVVIADTASDLQDKLDDLKEAMTVEEGDLEIESGRTFKATASRVVIPSVHYNQTRASFEITFTCTKPYAEGSTITAGLTPQSGQFTVSGTIVISGTSFNRPTIIYTPAGAGNTGINSLTLNHVPTGQQLTVSGFGSGAGLDASNSITINTDTFISLEGTSEIDNSGVFPRWEPGSNAFTLTVNGAYPGGEVTISYKPRYL